MQNGKNGWREIFAGGNALAAAVLVGGVGLQAIETFIGSTLLPSVVRDIGGIDLFAWNTTLFIVASILASVFAAVRPFGIGAQGRNADFLWQSPDDWGDALGSVLDEWIGEVAESLAFSIVAAIAVIDVEAVIIDGAFPVEVRRRIIERTEAAIARVSRRGFLPSVRSKARSATPPAPWGAPACHCWPTSRRIAKSCSKKTPSNATDLLFQ